MKRQRIKSFAIILMALASMQNVHATISRVSPSGHTLYYEFTNGSLALGSVFLTFSGSYSNYSGVLEIPDSVQYNSVWYRVTYIDYNAFNGCSGLTTPNTYW